MALSAKLFGSHFWAFRLPSVAAGALLMVGVMATITKFGLSIESHASRVTRGVDSTAEYGRMGLIAAAVFALNLEVCAWGSTGLSDMLLTSTMSGCLLSFFWGYAGASEERLPWGYYTSAVFMGLAVLTKGPIGILLPVLVCASFLIICQDTYALKEVPWLSGLSIVTLMNLPWYSAMTLRHGSMYLATFFGYHNIERYTIGINNHGGRPWWYSLAVVLLMYFPWSVFLPTSISAIVKQRIHPGLRAVDVPRGNRLSWFALAWVGVVFAFFGLSASQLPSYYLPMAPAVAMLVASLLGSSSRRVATAVVITSSLLALLYVAISAALFSLPRILLSTGGDYTAVTMAGLVQQHGMHFWGASIMLTAGFAALAVSVHQVRQSHQQETLVKDGGHVHSLPDIQDTSMKGGYLTFIVNAAAMAALFVFLIGPMYRTVDSVRQAPLRELSLLASQVQHQGEPLVMLGPRMPSVVFYSRLPVAFFDTAEEAERVLRDDMDRRVDSSLVIQPGQDDPSIANAEVLARKGDYLLYRVKRGAPAQL